MGLSKYPTFLDDALSLPAAVDLVTPVNAAGYNRLLDAILAIETELGVDPSRVFGTVRERLDNLRAVLTVAQQDIVAINTELGVNPSGTFSTVEGRLNNVDTRLGGIDALLVSLQAEIDAVEAAIDPLAASSIDSSQQIVIPLAINAEIDVSVFSAIGGDEINPSTLPTLGRTITFISRISTTDIALSADIRLFNITDGVPVAIAGASGFALTPERREVVLSSGGVSNDAGWAIDAEKTYEVQLKMSTATGTDSVFCQKAEIIITWT